MKAGLKLALSTLIKQYCGILIDNYTISGQKAVGDHAPSKDPSHLLSWLDHCSASVKACSVDRAVISRCIT